MTRRLQHTLYALSGSALALSGMLMLQQPLDPAGLGGAPSHSLAVIEAATAEVDAEQPPSSPHPRHATRRARAAVAMPYFSFAQLRGLTRS